MKTIQRPGIDPIWLSRSKDTTIDLEESGDERIPLYLERLESYVLSGVSLDDWQELSKPDGRWQIGLSGDLMRYAMVRCLQVEQKGIQGEPFNIALASDAFEAAYTGQLIMLHNQYKTPADWHGRLNPEIPWFTLMYTALGIVIGAGEKAFKLARLQLYAYYDGHFDKEDEEYCPIYYFILRLFADYLDESPLTLIGEAKEDPIFPALFDQWRNPDFGSLGEICMAVCDYHTHRCYTESYSPVEFVNGDFARIPIEILLLFKLRSLIGLKNPEIDHPMVNNSLGVLPWEPAMEPGNLIKQVRLRMEQDGFVEQSIFDRWVDLTERSTQASGGTDDFSNEEWTLLVDYLEDGEAEFSEHGCNDFILPATTANIKIFSAVLAHSDAAVHDFSAEKIRISSREVFIYDDWVMAYFSHRCKKQLAKSENGTAFSVAEYQVMSEVLKRIHQAHKERADDGDGYQYEFPINLQDAHKALLAEVVAWLQGNTGMIGSIHDDSVQERISSIERILADPDNTLAEVDVPDFWIMAYFAHKCQVLAGC